MESVNLQYELHELLTCHKLNKLVQQTSWIYDTKTSILMP